MAKAKVVEKKWKKVGQSKTNFFQDYIFPQDIQGFLTSVERIKATKKFDAQIAGTIMQNDGTPIQLKGSLKSGLGKFFDNTKVGTKVRILYTGGNLEDGRVLPKGIKDYKAFKKWKKKERFFKDMEFFTL